MLKKAFCLLLGFVLLSASLPAFAEEGAKKDAMQDASAGKDRWEGIVSRSNKDKSTLTVRKKGSSQERQVVYDSSTKWTAQEHGSKKANTIDASQVKDGDRVIVVGKFDDKSVLHATLISKRLTN
jgi:hypothetical protein